MLGILSASVTEVLITLRKQNRATEAIDKCFQLHTSMQLRYECQNKLMCGRRHWLLVWILIPFLKLVSVDKKFVIFDENSVVAELSESAFDAKRIFSNVGFFFQTM